MQYVDVIIEQAPVRAVTQDDNSCLIIGKVTSFSGTNNPVEATSLSTLEASGIESSNGGVLYKAAKSFFAGNGSGTRRAKLYAYAFTGSESGTSITNEEMLGVVNGTNATFKTKSSPVSDLSISIKWTDDDDAVTQPSGVYEKETVGTLDSGEITFDDGEVLVVVESGVGVPPTYASKGDLGTTYPDAKIFANYTISGLANVLREMREKNIKNWMFAYDETETLMASGYYSGDGGSWLMDQVIASKECLIAEQQQKERAYFFSWPNSVLADDDIPSSLRTGFSSMKYKELSTVVGNRHVNAIQHMNLLSSGQPTDNVAAMYMGIVAGNEPKSRGFQMRAIPVTQSSYPLQTEVEKLESAKVACIIQLPDIYPGESLISSGYSYGSSGYESYTEYNQCMMKLATEFRARIHDAIRNDLRVNKQGTMALDSTIRATCTNMARQGVIDRLATYDDLESGEKPIENPLRDVFNKKNKTSEDREYIALYRTSKTYPPVIVRIIWSGSVKEITLRVRVVA